MDMPASDWNLRRLQPKQLEPYHDFFSVMTYDLHGPWDGDVKQVGAVRADEHPQDR